MSRFLLISAWLCSCAALADSNSPVVDQSAISNTGQGYQGNVSVNQAAGDQQQQVNGRAIAIGTQAQSTGQYRQQISTRADPARDARSVIESNAFSNGDGILGVNQSSGANNQQINAVRLSISVQPQSIDDSALSQQNVALLQGSGSSEHSPGNRQVATSDQAFTGSRGVVQLNQSAGVGNQSINALSVRVSN
ncbi:adhesin [Pseudomonas sp. CCI3.2]|uniref:adhesin n=1 Tax=unclassified Pseudomonas TaxID=196821 RepID=UPI002AC96854|nr:MULTISPECIES: adhesin [unclassified Pseudomonas]MEB0076183.1 adhesin [Pseudomonas sp. MH10out]MEB0090678.1 adhesin [Pseudomonas sp. CCI4.2]MEB0100644.1 adhesin [Pseudomonas sp. CCI3.2]MEB0131853.1 adhesin [Pseudomonas sp. CCI2.4]MEB0156064.1 adhesin [Pseudomonas sp. AH2 (2023)]